MAQIPQINNPITAKNYNYSSRPMDPNTEPFDIVKLAGVQGSGNSSSSGARSRLEMGNRELIPLQVQVAKDPTLAVETLKDLLNIEVLNQALINGHTELYGKLEVSETELIQNECLYRPCYCGSYQHNEGNGSTHARRLVEFFGNSEEGADTEELVKYIVVNKYARHKYYKKRLDSIHILLGLLC